jgi:Fe-Mn family superoxide dismutase
MFGPGFVWLIKNTDKSRYSLLTTYLAGSPYPGAHYRRQAVDMNTESAQSISNLSAAEYARQNIVQNSAGAFGSSSTSFVGTGGVGLMPILCVNTWEHVWLRDWGIGGKRGFLEAWWNMVDWNVVAGNADIGQHIPNRR